MRDCAGQGADPFSDDPFGRQSKPVVRGKPISVRFEVTDPLGEPISGARVLAIGTRPGVLTDRNGTAVWKTGEDNLKALAKKKDGDLRFIVFPPREGGVRARVEKTVSSTDVLNGIPLRFRMLPGVTLRGRVVGRQDGKPVNGVTLSLRVKTASGAETSSATSTNEQGDWSFVLPRIESQVQVVALGHPGGYDFSLDTSKRSNNQHRYSRQVDVGDDAELVDVPVFEVEQIPPRRVIVVDKDGAPVADAKVQAMLQRWLNGDFPIWEPFYFESTDSDGNCVLIFYEANWRDAVVDASGTVDGQKVVGRASIPAENTGPIRVVVTRPVRIAGELVRAEEPAAGVKLVLYEAIQSASGDWKSNGLRGEVTTDRQGRYEFAATPGVPYLVATHDRKPDGTQTPLHWIRQPLTTNDYEAPAIDILRVNADGQK